MGACDRSSDWVFRVREPVGYVSSCDQRNCATLSGGQATLSGGQEVRPFSLSSLSSLPRPNLEAHPFTRPLNLCGEGFFVETSSILATNDLYFCQQFHILDGQPLFHFFTFPGGPRKGWSAGWGSDSRGVLRERFVRPKFEFPPGRPSTEWELPPPGSSGGEAGGEGGGEASFGDVAAKAASCGGGGEASFGDVFRSDSGARADSSSASRISRGSRREIRDAEEESSGGRSAEKSSSASGEAASRDSMTVSLEEEDSPPPRTRSCSAAAAAPAEKTRSAAAAAPSEEEEEEEEPGPAGPGAALPWDNSCGGGGGGADVGNARGRPPAAVLWADTSFSSKAGLIGLICSGTVSRAGGRSTANHEFRRREDPLSAPENAWKIVPAEEPRSRGNNCAPAAPREEGRICAPLT